jgi:hypothetical protein
MHQLQGHAGIDDVRRAEEKRHPPDDLADFTLQTKLDVSYVAFPGISIAPGRNVIPVPRYRGSTNDKSEDRAPVVAAAGAALALVLR